MKERSKQCTHPGERQSQSKGTVREWRAVQKEGLGSSRKWGMLCLLQSLQGKAAEHTSGQRSSTSAAQTSSIDITLEIVRKANSWTPPQIYWRHAAGENWQPVAANPPGHSGAPRCLRTLQAEAIRYLCILPFREVQLASGYGIPSVPQTHRKPHCQYIVKVTLRRIWEITPLSFPE